MLNCLISYSFEFKVSFWCKKLDFNLPGKYINKMLATQCGMFISVLHIKNWFLSFFNFTKATLCTTLTCPKTNKSYQVITKGNG